MSTMASQITGVSIICSVTDQRKIRVTGLYEGNPTVTGRFPSQMASNAENISIWWRHHESDSNKYSYETVSSVPLPGLLCTNLVAHTCSTK